MCNWIEVLLPLHFNRELQIGDENIQFKAPQERRPTSVLDSVIWEKPADDMQNHQFAASKPADGWKAESSTNFVFY
jgi:hypothetical protein